MAHPPPAYRGTDPYIFVCYSHADENLVFPEIRWLQNQGINVWYDTTGIGPGSEWNDEIARAIKGASHFLYFVTPRSVVSEHCRRELSFAQSESPHVVVAHLKETSLPDGLRLSLDNRQAILMYRLSADEYQTSLLHALAHVSVAATQTSKGTAESAKVERHLRRGVPIVLGMIVAASLAWWYSSQPSNSTGDVPAVHDARSIAVLPFVNVSNDPDQEFFSDGVAEDILNGLARSAPHLIVRPRSTSFALKGQLLDVATIGERLDVSHVLEGSVRRSGNTVRVNVQLSEVAANRSVWSGRYDRDVTDIFEVQDEITDEILTAMSIELGESRGSREFAGLDAYNAFLRGRYHSGQGEVETALEWFEKATRLDPSNADAWAERARLLDWSLFRSSLPTTAETRERRSRYIEHALAIDPSHPDALAHKASLIFTEDLRYQRSIDQLAAVVSANPNSPNALMYLSFVLGAIDRQSDAYYRTARRRSLLENSPNSELEMLTSSGRLEEARIVLERATALGRTPRLIFAASLAVAERDVDELESVLAQWSGHPSAPGRHLYFSALVPYLRADFDRAREIISTREQAGGDLTFIQRFRIALIERDFDAAVDYFAKAVYSAEPAAIFWHFNTHELESLFPELVAHPRYQALLVELGLDSASRAQIRIPELPF